VEIVVSGRHTEVPERFRRLAEEKLLKIGQLAPKAHRTDVELSHERNPRQSQNCEKVEITVRGKGPVVRVAAGGASPDAPAGSSAEASTGPSTSASISASTGASASPSTGAAASAGAPGAALDEAGAALEADEGTAEGEHGSPADAPDGASPVVIRAKDHDAAPMTLDQALYEMELVGHDFYLFVDAESGRPSVVYRRRGWNYGVIRLRVTSSSALPSQSADTADSSGSTGSLGTVDVTDVPAGSSVSRLG
jgi:ribosomal subunit interface protein